MAIAQEIPSSAAIADSGEEPRFEIRVSRHFSSWLDAERVSLAFTIPSEKLFLVGLKPDGRLSVFERSFNHCMGVAAVNTQTLYLSTRYQIWQMENPLKPGQLTQDGYDRLFIPRVAYTTGLLNTHDVTVDGDGRVIFAATRFGCLATISSRYSFVPLWKPPFLSDIAPGDRCHLNGIAMHNGSPAYVTSVSRTDVPESWREHRRDGGVVTDVATNEVVVTGLSMPHSPRCYQGEYWLTNSGTGEFGRIDLLRGRFEPIAFAPGFLRGLSFVGNYAVVGSSKPRRGNLYSGLALDEDLATKRLEARLGLFVVDLRSGEVVHWLFIESAMRELYDVIALPGVRKPKALGLVTDEIEREIWFEPGALAS